MAYNNFHNGEIDESDEILDLLNDMYMNDEYSDVTFIVEAQRIPANKTILSLRSSYFRSMFGGGFAESAQREIGLNVPLDVFKAILRFTYTGCLSLGTFDCHQIIQIYGLAEQYDLSVSMKKIILDYLTANLTMDNCVAILDAAHLFSITDVQIACMEFMDRHSIKLLDHDSFKALSLECLCVLLKRDTFYAPEIDIFKAVRNWLTVNSDADVQKALSTVRWSKLSMDDYLKVVVPSKVLEQTQLLTFMQNCNELSNAASRVPCSENGIEANFATTEYGAKVISGENPSALFSGELTDHDWQAGCTYHAINKSIYKKSKALLSSRITVDLGKVRFINNIKFWLMDKDSRSYSYRIDVSTNGEEYIRLFDHSIYNYRSWQDLYFHSRPVRFINVIGIRVNDVSEKRPGFHYTYGILESTDYDSFDILGFHAMYTKNHPEMIDGIVKPTKNIAKVEFGAIVEGNSENNMLNLNTDEFTCHEKDRFILLQLNQPYHIGSLRMLLGNNMNYSNKYSFSIETSVDKRKWTMAVDKRDEYLTGWQELDFDPRPTIYIKITGTQTDANFVCTYFECPRNAKKPKLECPLE